MEVNRIRRVDNPARSINLGTNRSNTTTLAPMTAAESRSSSGTKRLAEPTREQVNERIVGIPSMMFGIPTVLGSESVFLMENSDDPATKGIEKIYKDSIEG
jgi:hypothetical protein